MSILNIELCQDAGRFVLNTATNSVPRLRLSSSSLKDIDGPEAPTILTETDRATASLLWDSAPVVLDYL